MLVAQISDTHLLSPTSDLPAAQLRADCLERCVTEINHESPDAVILTGDTVQHGRADEYGWLRELLAPLQAPLYLVPGNRETPLYFVTADFAVDAISTILERGDNGAIYHVCHTAQESMTLGGLIDTAFSRFELDPDFRERRILQPLLCDESSFRLLVEGIDGFGGDVVRQGLASILPFAPQLFSRKSFENQHLQKIMDVYAAPDATELVANTSDHLVGTRWGRRLDNAA